MAVATSGTALLRFGEGPRPVDTSTAAGGGVLGGTVVWLRASCGALLASIAPEPAPVAEEVLPDWLHSGVGTRRERADRKPPDGSSRERILPVMRYLVHGSGGGPDCRFWRLCGVRHAARWGQIDAVLWSESFFVVPSSESGSSPPRPGSVRPPPVWVVKSGRCLRAGPGRHRSLLYAVAGPRRLSRRNAHHRLATFR